MPTNFSAGKAKVNENWEGKKTMHLSLNFLKPSSHNWYKGYKMSNLKIEFFFVLMIIKVSCIYLVTKSTFFVTMQC